VAHGGVEECDDADGEEKEYEVRGIHRNDE
jgi:hypothetical protein